MKILIMVLSCNEPLYIEMRKVQQETWDSVQVEGVDTIYYIGGGGEQPVFTKINDSSQELLLGCPDDYGRMHWKLKNALEVIDYKKYDLIFKTNSSSYINKELLLKFAEKLPREKCYCGISGVTFASGCGVFLSHDCIEILLNIYDDYPVPSEDALTGGYLSRHGIGVTPGAQRVDITHSQNWCEVTTKSYHYRVKHDYDRQNDMMIMKRLFEIHGKPNS